MFEPVTVDVARSYKFRAIKLAREQLERREMALPSAFPLPRVPGRISVTRLSPFAAAAAALALADIMHDEPETLGMFPRNFFGKQPRVVRQRREDPKTKRLHKAQRAARKARRKGEG